MHVCEEEQTREGGAGLQLETTEYLFQAAEAMRHTPSFDGAYRLAAEAAVNNTRFIFKHGWDSVNGEGLCKTFF